MKRKGANVGFSTIDHTRNTIMGLMNVFYEDTNESKKQGLCAFLTYTILSAYHDIRTVQAHRHVDILLLRPSTYSPQKLRFTKILRYTDFKKHIDGESLVLPF